MLDRIRACVSALPPAEQRVAKLVLADARGLASLPVGGLAARANVSKPTVVRFCRSVGYDGLADFKRKLAGSVNEGVPFVHRAVDDDDGAAEIVVKVIDNAVSAMLKYRNAAAGHAFERAIAALAEAGRGQRHDRPRRLRLGRGTVMTAPRPTSTWVDPPRGSGLAWERPGAAAR